MKDFTFSPPNRGALWTSLALTKTQVAELCGLTTRQVSHWTNQGYISTAGPHPERYNGEAIDLCVMIKQGLMNGIPLRRAVLMAREHLAQEMGLQPGIRAIDPPALLDIRDKLRSAESAISTVLEAVTPLLPIQFGELIDDEAAE